MKVCGGGAGPIPIQMAETGLLSRVERSPSYSDTSLLARERFTSWCLEAPGTLSPIEFLTIGRVSLFCGRGPVECFGLTVGLDDSPTGASFFLGSSEDDHELE